CDRGPSFVVASGTKSGPARFVFASEDGTISGWNPTVAATQAVVGVDNSAGGAVYKGLAIASTAAGDRLYATNFHAGTVEVFDAGFHPVLAGFTDADTGWNPAANTDRKSTRLNSSHDQRSYAGSCL